MSPRHLFASLLIAVTLLFLPLLTPTFAHAQDFGFEWTGVCVGGAKNDVATIQGIECLMANVLTVFIAMIGLAAFVMIVVAAFRYLLSGGNTKGTEQARSTVTFAIVGIVVALSAFIILNLLTAFTGVDLTTFTIPRDTDDFTGPQSISCTGTCVTTPMVCTGGGGTVGGGTCQPGQVCCIK